MKPTRPSSPPARHWRISLPMSLGAVLLLASLVVAAVSLRSRADDGSSHSTAPSIPASGQRWMCLGKVDVNGAVTPIYPLQPGRVESIEAIENEPVKAGTPLFHLENTIPVLKVRQAEDALRGSRQKQVVAEARVQQAEAQMAAQQEAVSIAQDEVKRARIQYNHEKKFEKRGLSGDRDSVESAEIQVGQAEKKVRAEQKKLAAFQAGKQEAQGYVELARVDVAAKESQIEEARNAVQECIVRAPVDGTPLRVQVGKGQVLGSNPKEAAVMFAPDGPLLVRAEVEQEFVPRVRKEQMVIIKDHVSDQECARGRVVSIARWYAAPRTASPQMLSMNNEVRTLECIVKIESTSQEVRIGQRVRVEFPE